MALEYATRASKGARSYQEDAAFVRAEPGSAAADQNGSASQLTAVLADGMGGHAGGALASSTACQIFMRAYETSAGEVPARLGEALQLANAAIANCVEENPALNGMGCTLVGTTFGPAGVEWVSVGDSPMFLVRRGEIFLLNEDHSLAPEIDKLAAAGKMTWEDAQCRSAPAFPPLGADRGRDRAHRPLACAPRAGARRRLDHGQRRHPHLGPRGHPGRG